MKAKDANPVALLTAARLTGKDMGGALEKVVKAHEDLLASGITQRAITVLLKDLLRNERVSKTEIDMVLNALPRLREFLQ